MFCVRWLHPKTSAGLTPLMCNVHIHIYGLKFGYTSYRAKFCVDSESVIRFIGGELEEPDLQQPLNCDCSGNVTMMSPKSVDQFVKIISEHLETSCLEKSEVYKP